MDSQLEQNDPASGPVDGINNTSGLCASDLQHDPCSPNVESQCPPWMTCVKGIFPLAHGYVQYLPRQLKDNGKWSIPMFAFINKNCSKGIMLFGSQVNRLIHELPAAYKAMSAPEKEYTVVVAKNTVQKITLEVRPYLGRTYLFLKKYYNEKDWSKRIAADMSASSKKTSSEASGPLDAPVWLPCKGAVLLDPQHDDPGKLLAFILSCCH